MRETLSTNDQVYPGEHYRTNDQVYPGEHYRTNDQVCPGEHYRTNDQVCPGEHYRLPSPYADIHTNMQIQIPPVPPVPENFSCWDGRLENITEYQRGVNEL